MTNVVVVGAHRRVTANAADSAADSDASAAVVVPLGGRWLLADPDNGEPSAVTDINPTAG